MQIIFDEKLIPKLKERHIVLELDTIFHEGMTKPITLYTIIEYPGLEDFSLLNSIIEQHNEMITHYKSANLAEAAKMAQNLKEAWNSKLDDFYSSVIETCHYYVENNLKWDGIKYTTPTN